MATGLQGSNDHGYSTDEDFNRILEEGKERNLETGEIYALLRHHNRFPVTNNPLKLPTRGTIVFFNRRQLRRYWKDGHEWEKKNHSFLKVQKERKIRVRYAHGRDGLNIFRKSYWLIDENRRPVNDVVLVHYDEKPRDIGRRGISGPPGDFAFQNHCQTLNDYNTRECDELEDSHCQTLRYLNTCEWHELLQQEDSNNSTAPIKGEALVDNQSNPTAACVSRVDVEESGANHTNMEEISESTGSGNNVQNRVQIPDNLGLLFWTELLDPSYSNNSTSPPGDEVFVDNQPNGTGVRGWWDDDTA